MEKNSLTLPEIKLAGIAVRTSYQQEFDKMNGKIFPCVKKYYHESIFERIKNRKKPGTTFCVYTDYESDYKGAYTYFIGEEVLTFDHDLKEEGLQKLVIPKQKYAKFTNGPAAMPDVIVKAWEEIWEMSPSELGGSRHYHTDFEIYDERAVDHENIVLDVFVGVQ
ncbi:MAG: hypothetical protein S4CHLAM37_04340 [Chlamydiia bacterium]|nr:hypothetical protein [Chlamydiia bacterium]